MKLHPFRALHPTPDSAHRVVSPPYDVVSTVEAREIAGDNPDSFLRVLRPEIDLPPGTDLYSDPVYATAAANLRGLIERGALVSDATPALWLYRLTMGTQQQVGFFGVSEVNDYVGGRIKRHEFTRPVKEDDRTRHVDTLRAQAGPVFLTCRDDDGRLAALQAELIAAGGAPYIDVRGQHEVRHELWPVYESTPLERTAEAFDRVDAFYIADGHHRAASASRARDLARGRTPDAPADADFERFATVVFPAPQLKILAYNRVICDVHGHTTAGFLDALGGAFEVGPPGAPGADLPAARHTFGLYVAGAWRALKARPGVVDESDPVRCLDVSILQERALSPLLGITDPRTSKRLEFVGGIRGTAELARRVDARGAGCAFSMFPTSVEELLAVADSGQVMPPKSTWFEPKLASGLLIHRFRAQGG